MVESGCKMPAGEAYWRLSRMIFVYTSEGSESGCSVPEETALEGDSSSAAGVQSQRKIQCLDNVGLRTSIPSPQIHPVTTKLSSSESTVRQHLEIQLPVSVTAASGITTNNQPREVTVVPTQRLQPRLPVSVTAASGITSNQPRAVTVVPTQRLQPRLPVSVTAASGITNNQPRAVTGVPTQRLQPRLPVSVTAASGITSNQPRAVTVVPTKRLQSRLPVSVTPASGITTSNQPRAVTVVPTQRLQPRLPVSATAASGITSNQPRAVTVVPTPRSQPRATSSELPDASALLTTESQQHRVTDAPRLTPTTPSLQRPAEAATRRHCRCGLTSAAAIPLTCLGQRCPCFAAGISCSGCRCKGCRNPVDKIIELYGKTQGADGDDNAGDDGEPPKTYVVNVVKL
ncbi:uncharacterized protein LOC119160991 [Rhipicephalus microplus]|uniref:uncharacterized protein LOC119160991 n=1 Tax=Rhipicephalus microplus TaxID=6941 RepID=UPI0018898207|nr:protein lin-54 homolog [Rhipicephalus microplus]